MGNGIDLAICHLPFAISDQAGVFSGLLVNLHCDCSGFSSPSTVGISSETVG
jgi:hypothetical protein